MLHRKNSRNTKKAPPGRHRHRPPLPVFFSSEISDGEILYFPAQITNNFRKLYCDGRSHPSCENERMRRKCFGGFFSFREKSSFSVGSFRCYLKASNKCEKRGIVINAANGMMADRGLIASIIRIKIFFFFSFPRCY